MNQSLLKTRYIDNIRIINESGLYSLILSSKLESAKRFKKWVTSEVLPSIRKTGEYKTSSGGKGILVPDFSNPADPRLVKAPDVFPLSYNIYNESNDFNYINDNNFNFTVNFFIDYPFGGNNPSLGVNAWGVFPFGLRFMKTPAYDMVYILNAGTRNPSVYADMVDIPKLKQFNNNISINFNPLSIQQGDNSTK